MFFKRNNAAIINRLDSLHGLVGANNDALAELLADKLTKVLAPKAELEISEQFDLASPRMVRDISQAIQQRLENAIDGVKSQATNHLGVLSCAIYKTHNTQLSKLKDIEMRLAVVEGETLNTQTTANKLTHTLGDALDQSNQNFEEMARQAAIHDAANGDRMLSVFDKMRALEHMIGHKHMLTHAKLAAMFTSLSAQINDLRPKDRAQYRTHPSVEWFMDNLDTMIEVAHIAELVRKNHIPRDKGAYELVKAIRKVHPYSIENLTQEVKSKLESWEQFQDFCNAA